MPSFGTVFQNSRSTGGGGDIDLTIANVEVVDSADNALIVLVFTRMQGYVSPIPIGVAWGATSMARRAAFARVFVTDGAGDDGQINLYGILTPGAGTHDVVVDMANSINNSAVAAYAFEVKNVDAATAAALFGTPAGTGPTSGTSISDNVSSAVGNVVIDGLGKVGGTALSIGAGQTQLGTEIATSWFSCAASYEAGAATVTMSWSWTTSVGCGHEGVGLTGKAAGAAGLDQHLEIPEEE